MEAQLTINGELADLGDLDFTFDINIKDFQNLSTIRSSKSSSIIIPASPKNRKLLDYLEDTRIIKSRALKSAVLKVGGLSMEGKLKIYEAETEGGYSEYRIQIINNSGDWTEQLKDKKLNELDFSGDNHVLSKAVVDTSETFDTTTDFLTRRNYVYPIISYGRTIEDFKFNIVERYPAINIRSIVYRIFHELGYDVQGTLGALITRLHLPYTGTGKLDGTADGELESELFKASIDPVETKIDTIAVGVGEPVSIEYDPIGLDAEDFDNGSNFSITTGKYTVPSDRAMNFKGSVNLTLNANAFIENTDIDITIKIMNGITPLKTVSLTSVAFNPPALYTLTQEIESGYQDLSAGDEIYYYVLISGTCDNTDTGSNDITASISTTTYLENANVDWYGEGATVEISEILPETLQTSFLKGIFQAFNVIPITDNKRRIIYLNAKKNMFTGEVIEFEQDMSKRVNIVQPSRTSYIVGFKNDSSDFADLEILEPYEYLVDDSEKEVPLINDVFASTLMDKDYYSTGNFVITFPKIWKDALQKDSTGVSFAPEWETNHTLRLLYYNGISSGNWNFKAGGEDYARTTYPDLLSYNASYNYNFKDINGVSGLFNTYWAATVAQINNNQIVSVYFKINTNQIQGFLDAELNRDARSYLYWNNDYWEILSIKKVNVQKSESTQFELLKKKISRDIYGKLVYTFDSTMETWDSTIITFDLI